MSAEEWLIAKVMERLSVFDALPMRAASTGVRKLAASVCAALLAELLPRATPPELLGGLHAWRALAQAHAPPRLLIVGGYNSNWNTHEPVPQEGDAMGCEDSGEVVCSLTGIEGSERWRCALPPMMLKRADVAVVSTSPKILFALGGRQGETRHASVERLDLVQWQLKGQSWEEMPSMLECRSGLAATLMGDQLLVAGGRSSTKGVLRKAEYCDIRRGTAFVPMSDMQQPREYAAAAAVGDEFWVMGGGSDGRSSTVEIWDAQGEWRQGPEMRERRYGASAIWHQGRLYVVGGSHQFRKRKFTTLESLDPREGVWDCCDVEAAEHQRYQSSLWGAGVAALDQSLYLCGGTFRDLEESLTTIYRIDLRTKQLSTVKLSSGADCSLQVPRWCGGACIV